MSAKHTPGPWHYVGDSLTHRQFSIYAPGSAPNMHVCTVNDLPVERLYSRDQGQAEATARLIAAAPDILDALEGLLNALPSATTHPSVAQARRAVAKARGES